MIKVIMRRKSPISIQQWVDSLPTSAQQNKNISNETNDIMTDRKNNCDDMKNNASTSPVSGINNCSNNTLSRGSLFKDFRSVLSRDASFQSDDASSHCSSVESVLELRKPDPEAVLIGLGFGPSFEQDETSRIPKRFLQPSKLAGVDVEQFLQKQRAAKEAAANYYWPHLRSSLNIGRDITNKKLPLKEKDSSNLNNTSL